MNIKKDSIPIFMALLGAVLFSSKAVLVKFAYQYDVPSLTLLVLRMGFALPIYLAVAFNKPRHSYNEKISQKEWLLLLILGVIGYYFASYLDFLGLKYISASLERLILFVYPTITTIMAVIFLKRRINKIQVLAIFLSYLGIALAFGDNLFIDQQENFWLGAGLIFGSAFTFSIYLVGSEKLIPKFGSKRFTTYCMIISCTAVLIHFGLFGNNELTTLKWQVYVISLAIAIFCTVLPSFLISAAIEKIGSSKTATLSSIGPISVIASAGIFLGEEITIFKLSGTIIVLLGVYLISKK